MIFSSFPVCLVLPICTLINKFIHTCHSTLPQARSETPWSTATQSGRSLSGSTATQSREALTPCASPAQTYTLSGWVGVDGGWGWCGMDVVVCLVFWVVSVRQWVSVDDALLLWHFQTEVIKSKLENSITDSFCWASKIFYAHILPLKH